MRQPEIKEYIHIFVKFGIHTSQEIQRHSKIIFVNSFWIVLSIFFILDIAL
jgi:hypothetical protein